MNSEIFDAIMTQHLLLIRFKDRVWKVEPHAYGIGINGGELLLAWKISEHPKDAGWVHVNLSETRGLQLLSELFESPRPGYTRGDAAFAEIYKQV